MLLSKYSKYIPSAIQTLHYILRTTYYNPHSILVREGRRVTSIFSRKQDSKSVKGKLGIFF